MTDIEQLFSGIGVVIDDEIKTDGSSIKKVVSSFKENHIPCLLYEKLPLDEEIQAFHSISFILLDWKWNVDAPDEVLLGDNVEFIEKVHKVSFVPIFIFTNEEPSSVIELLQSKGIYSDKKNNLIFVKNKEDIETSDKLFTAIEEWVKQTLPVYIIKEWDNKKRIASTELFQRLYKINPCWVDIFIRTSEKDGVNSAYELNELLFENLHSQMQLINLTDLPSHDSGMRYNANEIRDIMQGQRILPKENLLPEMIFTGDIYYESGEYYINVRPQCDCIPRDGVSLDDIALYLIKGEEKQISQCNYSRKNGNFADIETRVTIFPIDHKAIQFGLGEFSVKRFSDMKEKRIGRLLPPFITKLVQKYALYMQRQALPRIPEDSTKFDENG